MITINEIRLEIKKLSELTPTEKEANLKFLKEIFFDWPNYENIVYVDPGIEDCIMAYDGDKLVGHVVITRRVVEHNGKVFQVGGTGDLAVAKDYRKIGIGKILDQKCKEILKANNFDLGLAFCHPEVEKHHLANGWIKKEKGIIWATIGGVKEKQNIAIFWPIKLSDEEIKWWNNDEIDIGVGSW